MIACPACRSPVPPEARFCPSCGSPAPDLTSPETMESPSSRPPSSHPSRHGRFEPGHRLGPRYRMVGLLGEGGMGEVYRADDLELGQSVALKFLPDRYTADPLALDRFRREVRVARGVSHPNVAAMYDIATVDGHVFLVMEYIDGEDLASVLRRMGRPSPDKALEIARQLCLGVGAAHEAGVLHRDLKPANIMIDGRGKVRITDFGLAGLADELARGSEIAGTPAYMAPEQLRDGKVSAASDVYALGLILHEIFTGKRVFDTQNVMELKRLHSQSAISSPTSIVHDLDPAVERVLLRCLDADPGQRPQSAYAVLAGLPGGDPLAAALAAGETPSPELVADAGERGVVSPRVGVPALVLILAVMLGVSWFREDTLRPLTQPPSVLGVRADEAYRRVVGSDPPRFHADGFTRQVPDSLSGRPPFDTGFLYWRLWSAVPIVSDEFHAELIYPERLRRLRPGESGMVLDTEGRLRGFRRSLPDSIPRLGEANPAPIFEAMGVPGGEYTAAEPRTGPGPGVLAWERLQGTGPECIRAAFDGGALRSLTVLDPPVDTEQAFAEPADKKEPLPFVLITLVLPIAASAFFAVRNLRLGRGDLRGATLLALITFVGYMLEGLFSLSLDYAPLSSLLQRVLGGPPPGHALAHAAFVWLGYMTLEPYLRRVRPGTLVSWARLVDRRWRDPMLGRDVLVGLGGAAFLIATIMGLRQLELAMKGESHIGGPSGLETVSRIGAVLSQVAYGWGFAPPMVMAVLVVFLVLRILLRRDRLAMAAILLLAMVPPVLSQDWAGVTGGLCGAGTMLFCLFRFGVLAAIVLATVLNLFGSTPWALAPGAWYGGAAMIGPLTVCLLAVWAALTAMGGRISLGAALGETAPTGSRR